MTIAWHINQYHNPMRLYKPKEVKAYERKFSHLPTHVLKTETGPRVRFSANHSHLFSTRVWRAETGPVPVPASLQPSRNGARFRVALVRANRVDSIQLPTNTRPYSPSNIICQRRYKSGYVWRTSTKPGAIFQTGKAASPLELTRKGGDLYALRLCTRRGWWPCRLRAVLCLTVGPL